MEVSFSWFNRLYSNELVFSAEIECQLAKHSESQSLLLFKADIHTLLQVLKKEIEGQEQALIRKKVVEVCLLVSTLITKARKIEVELKVELKRTILLRQIEIMVQKLHEFLIIDHFRFFLEEDEEKKLLLLNPEIFTPLLSLDSKPVINWERTDVDFLQLVAALVECKALSDNSGKLLDRTKAIQMFGQLLNLSIKDAESKLSKASFRAKESFLETLSKRFDDYEAAKREK